jgi:hypothetical protein
MPHDAASDQFPGHHAPAGPDKRYGRQGGSIPLCAQQMAATVFSVKVTRPKDTTGPIRRQARIRSVCLNVYLANRRRSTLLAQCQRLLVTQPKTRPRPSQGQPGGGTLLNYGLRCMRRTRVWKRGSERMLSYAGSALRYSQTSRCSTARSSQRRAASLSPSLA